METQTEKTLPRAGLVSQIRQNWSVFEDQALAQQIQQQEISQHLISNRHRNQILREDIPQARKEQSLEEIQASREYNEYKQKLDQVSERDAQIAHELTKKQEFRVTHDAQYIAKRDEAFAKNLQRIEREYREKQSRNHKPGVPEPGQRGQHLTGVPDNVHHGHNATGVPDHGPRPHVPQPSHSRQTSEPYRGAVSSHHHSRTASDQYQHSSSGVYRDHNIVSESVNSVQYNDDQYQIQVASPAMITDEPLYMNNVGDLSSDNIMPPTPFRGHDLAQYHSSSGHDSSGEYVSRGEPSKRSSGQGQTSVHNTSRDTGHNISSEFSGGPGSSQSSLSRSRSSMASTSPSELMGACGGAGRVTPGDVLGIGSALSPAELRAAEAAERLLEQEKRDMEIARQLQVSEK